MSPDHRLLTANKRPTKLSKIELVNQSQHEKINTLFTQAAGLLMDSSRIWMVRTTLRRAWQINGCEVGPGLIYIHRGAVRGQCRGRGAAHGSRCLNGMHHPILYILLETFLHIIQ